MTSIVTRKQIEDLRDEAGVHGDDDTYEDCQTVLQHRKGHTSALKRVRNVILSALDAHHSASKDNQ